ncbi:MAG: hypothetical protein ISR45_10010 [Rhodospirillales bacterium]|nr:hypothetical protein [Rhodospirillales bacterium]
MKKVLFVMAVAAISTLPMSGARAVDIVNDDDTSHSISVGIEGDFQEFEIAAGETLKNVCQECIIQIGDGEPVIAEGDQLIVINDGKLN